MTINHSWIQWEWCVKKKKQIITFQENPDFQIKASDNTIKPVEYIKAFGVIIDKKLSWTTQHIDSIIQRITRIIKRKFDFDQMKNLITFKFLESFSLYYGSTVWLNPSLSSTNIKRLNRIHYAACSLMLRDWRNKLLRQKISEKTGRMMPRQWMVYAACNQMLKVQANSFNLWPYWNSPVLQQKIQQSENGGHVQRKNRGGKTSATGLTKLLTRSSLIGIEWTW